MINSLRGTIIKDKQIKKFCFYGLLKNLKFFESYLILFLLNKNLSLFQIGIIIAIRELVINLFEIPSGFIADYFGRKKELYLCFGFYIISFLLFYKTITFYDAIGGMIFFGLAEAFRSGTHKAMIYTYLDSKGWQKEKTFVYGRTRSFSLVGSSISSVLGIILILYIAEDNYLFLFSIIPYIIDLLLIISYPSFLDKQDKNKALPFKKMLNNLISGFRTNSTLRNIVLEEGMSEAVFAYIKDLLQPILESIVLGSGLLVILGLNTEIHLKIMLGVVYAVFNLTGAYFSKNTYLIKGSHKSSDCLYYIHIALSMVCGLLAMLTASLLIVCALYMILYILHSVRKPLFIDEIDNHIDKSNRATVLSVSTQLKSLFLLVSAPTLGLLADYYGISSVMLLLSIIFIITIPLLKLTSVK